MKVYDGSKIRNVAITGHGGSGKTTLVEAILYGNKVVDRFGKVEEGNTYSDFTKIEQDRGISIYTSICPVEIGGYKINFLDTPGYVDFIGEVEKTIPIVESVIINVNGVAGVEGQTTKMWKYVKKYKKTPLIFINKMDKEEAKFEEVVAQLKDELGPVAPMIIPIGKGENFKGVINLLEQKAYIYENGERKEVPIPEDMVDIAESMKEELVEAIAEVTDELTEKYLEEGSLTDEDIKEGVSIGFKEGTFIPLACGSALKMIGIKELEEIIINYLPGPFTKETIDLLDENGELVTVNKKDLGKFYGFVWKTFNEAHIGDLIYCKIISGSVKGGETFIVARTGNKEKTGTVMITSGKNRIEVPEVKAGDIVTFVKLKDVGINDTLADTAPKYIHPKIEFSEHVISVAIQPKSQSDQEKVTTALQSMIKHDPTLSLEIDAELRQMVLHGMGQIHLDVTLKILSEKYGVEISTKKPKVPYRETITSKAEGHYRHKKQTGGAGQFAEVYLRVEPLPRGQGFEFANEVFGGAISQQFIPSVEKGVRTVMAQGVLAGYPIIDIKAVVYDGKEHPVDSKDIAFQIASRFAFKDAFLKGRPVLLEPIYDIEVTVPEQFMGDIMGDLTSRRGRIMGTSQSGRSQVIKAQVPVAELYQYINDLRSMTQGRGEFIMRFSHYEEVPANLAEKIIEESKKEMEEENE